MIVLAGAISANIVLNCKSNFQNNFRKFMCGRYTLAGSPVDLEKQLRANLLKEASAKPSYNISPGSEILAVTNTQPETIRPIYWGLEPYWSKPGEKPQLLINVRSESFTDKPGFQKYLTSQRCLIPASGFYEWKQFGKQKQPYFISLPNEPIFCFAGIWEETILPNGLKKQSVAMITTTPNQLMKGIHNRMPVILKKENYEQWLSNRNTSDLAQLLLPFPAENMDAWPVRNLVSKSKKDGPELIEQDKPLPTQTSLFDE
jgi:putative SOS response-associated peptidase YedK